MMDQCENIAALGRPFDLGMLYDRRTDKLIIGKTLWSVGELKSDVNTIPCVSRNSEILCNDTMSETVQALGVEGRLKLNLLCREFNLEGAAKYLNDRKSSKDHTRVVLKYDRTTKLKHLTMDHLKNCKISHPEILDEDIATDVVVGIKYGGQVFMIFEREVEENESAKKVQVEMKAYVQVLKGMIPSGNGDVSCDHTTNEKQKIEKINCKAYSDFPTKENPSNYEEAVQFYKKLPSLIDEDEGVPVFVRLLPLNNLMSKSVTVRKGISATLLDKACFKIEHLNSVLEGCKDLIEEDNFPSITRQLSLFMKFVQEYKTFFQRKLSEIRAGSADDDDFAKFLKQHEQEAKVFSRSTLEKWLQEKRKKIETLQGVIKSLPGTRFVSSGELNGLLCNPNIYHVVCLTFKISSDQDAQVSNMEVFLEGCPIQQFEEPALPVVDPALVHQALERFTVLFDDNAERRVVEFVYTEEPLGSLGSDGEACVSVRYYYKGSLKAVNFTPLEKSRNLKVQDISSDHVKLSWDESFAHLNDIEDKVQYKSDHSEWQTSSAVCHEQTATINGLNPATRYTFRVHAPDQIFFRDNCETLEVETQQAPNSNDLFAFLQPILNLGGIGLCGIVLIGLIHVFGRH